MPANVEQMFSVRQVPWHRLGRIVTEAPTSERALVLAGLDWEVLQKPVMVDGQKVPGYVANVRSSDGRVLGIVSQWYKVVQNVEGFAFTDALLKEGVRYETAGSLAGGRRVWMLARMPEVYRLNGDETDTYLLFSNSHDGTGAIRVAVTPVRVVCANTLNLALSTTSRSWSTRHVGDMSSKLEEAQRTLALARDYMKELEAKADVLAQIRVTPDDWTDLVAKLVPMPKESEEKPASDWAKERAKERRQLLFNRIMVDDLERFRWTAWGAINAVADFAGHSEPVRKTITFEESRFTKVVDGHPLLDKAVELLGV